MDLEIYFHGVPNGQDIYGEEKARGYLSLFYGANDSDESKLVVEIRRIGDKSYCCYNLLNYNKVVAYDGRAGSFVGVTIKIDAFCKDIKKMYNLLYWVMKFRLVGICLKEEGEVTKYVVGSFEQRKEELDALKREMAMEIKKAFTSADFVPLPLINEDDKKAVKCNINDYSNEILASTIAKNGKLTVSPFLPTKNESSAIKEAAGKIAAVRENAEKEKETIMADLNRKMQQCTKLEQENSELQMKVKKLDSELRLNATRKEISSLVGQINEPIQKLAIKLDSLLPKAKKVDNSFMGGGPKKKIVIPVKVILLLLNLLLTLFLCANLIMSQQQASNPKSDVPESSNVSPNDTASNTQSGIQNEKDTTYNKTE